MDSVRLAVCSILKGDTRLDYEINVNDWGEISTSRDGEEGAPKYSGPQRNILSRM